MAELLSPAGTREALTAAVQCGADAVYLGMGAFNARRSAKNFSPESFAEAVRYCHARGVKVYLTLNTLLRDREMDEAADLLRHASRCGADAVLIQDWGVFRLAREVAPDLPVHASTQMSLFTLGGANYAASLGMERIVLARDLSREEIRTICEGCPAEIEVFVHGALCMCYSGQCAMSALIGQRSGNRGRCAQPCRLPYGVNEPACGGHPLSLKDANLSDALGELDEMGVSCLKLEGRMKRPEYVAVVTGIYRRLLDEKRRPTNEERAQLEAAFSRDGFTDGYYQGRKGPDMFGTRPENASEPKDLFAAARAAYEKEDLRKTPVTLHCRVCRNCPAVLTAEARGLNGRTFSVTAEGAVPEEAHHRSLTEEELKSRLAKTGGTVFSPAAITAETEPGLMLSAGNINALRREALSLLNEKLETQLGPDRRERSAAPLPEPPESAAAPAFTCSVSRAEQLTKELLDCRPEIVYIPAELLAELDLTAYRGRTRFCAVLPRVFRTEDEAKFRRLLSAAEGLDSVAVGNLGHLPVVKGLPLEIRGDFGLNVFNSRSLLFLHDQGLASATVSFELHHAQIRDLKKYLPCEAVVYGRLPLMITENCVIKNNAGCRCGEENALCDRTGARFPVLCQYGHRNEIENSRVLFLADKDDYRRCGLRWARLRFTDESPEECVRVFRRYRGEDDFEPAEFTRGLFYRGVE